MILFLVYIITYFGKCRWEKIGDYINKAMLQPVTHQKWGTSTSDQMKYVIYISLE